MQNRQKFSRPWIWAAETLINMAVIADVVFTVAVVAFTAGAVAEFQLRIADICTATDGAAMGVGGFGCGHGGLIRAGIGEGDHLGATGFLTNRLTLAEQPPGVGPPGNRDHIQHIGTAKAFFDIIYLQNTHALTP